MFMILDKICKKRWNLWELLWWKWL